MTKPKPKARDLIREVHREFRRLKAEAEPELLAQAQQPDKRHLVNEEMRNLIVAERVLRPCLEAVLDDLLPYSHLTAMELAIRLASLALSTGPLADQGKLVDLFLQGFPNAHDVRLAIGQVVATEWQTDAAVPEHQVN